VAGLLTGLALWEAGPWHDPRRRRVQRLISRRR